MSDDPRVLILGLDGATFTVLEPFMRSGLMPNLAKLTQGGVRADLRSTMPPLTPPAWTTLMTGKRPGHHGVFDFFQKEAPGSEYYRLSTSNDIKTPTIWSLASDYDKKVISLNFPVMFPAPQVNGSVVPGGWMPWRQLRLGCYPPGLFDRLKELPSFDPKELSLDMELEAKAIDGCPDDEYEEWIELHARREARWIEILTYLMTSEEPADLVAVMFDGTDKLQHLCWRFIDPASRPAEPTEWEQRMIDLCEGYYSKLDAMLGDIIELCGPNTTTVVASDHGFGPTWDMFYVNTWLEREGFLVWADESSATADDSAPRVGFDAMTRHITELDWSKTVAYAATPSSQGINVVEKLPGTDEPMTAERRAEIQAEIIARLEQVENPFTGSKMVTDIVTRDEAFSGPHELIAPDVSFMPADGAAISILRSDDVVRRRELANGNHRFEGIFICNGPDTRSGVIIDQVSITQIAALVLYSLGVPIPTDLDGDVPAEVFPPGHLDQVPPQFVEPVATVATNGSDIDLDADEEDMVVARLRALGYVE